MIEPVAVVAFPEAHVSLVDAWLRGLTSEHTRTVYRRAVEAYRVFLAGERLLLATRRDVEAWRAMLEAGGRKPATIAKSLSALSSFYAYAVDEGALAVNPAARARRPKVSDVSPRRGLSVDEVRRILAAAGEGNPTIALRDRALVVILAVQGLRISEVLGIEATDLDEEQGHRVARITRKGGAVVRVPLAAVTVAALDAWMTAGGIEAGPVFLAVLRGGRVQAGRAMSDQAAVKRIGFLAARAGVRHAHPHLFRHGAVTEGLAAGIPLHEVQDFAGHADPRTTQRYNAHRQSLNNPTPHVLAHRFHVDDKDPI